MTATSAEFVERRGSSFEFELSAAQELGYQGLAKLGWDIWFVRMTRLGPLAVLCRGEALCTLDHLGNTSFTPQIDLRAP